MRPKRRKEQEEDTPISSIHAELTLVHNHWYAPAVVCRRSWIRFVCAYHEDHDPRQRVLVYGSQRNRPHAPNVREPEKDTFFSHDIGARL
jgi:hypothetical protein